MKLSYIERQCKTVQNVDNDKKLKKLYDISNTLESDSNVLAIFLKNIGIDGNIVSDTVLRDLIRVMDINLDVRLSIGYALWQDKFINNVKRGLPTVKRITKDEESKFQINLYLHNKVDKVIPVAFSKCLFGIAIPQRVIGCAYKALQAYGNIQTLATEDSLADYYKIVLGFCQYKNITFKQFVEAVTGVYTPLDSLEKLGVVLLPHSKANILNLRTLEGHNITLTSEQFKYLYENNFLNKIIFKDVLGFKVPYLDDDKWLNPISLKSILNPGLVSITETVDPLNMVL